VFTGTISTKSFYLWWK